MRTLTLILLHDMKKIKFNVETILFSDTEVDVPLKILNN